MVCRQLEVGEFINIKEYNGLRLYVDGTMVPTCSQVTRTMDNPDIVVSVNYQLNEDGTIANRCRTMLFERQVYRHEDVWLEYGEDRKQGSEIMEYFE